jgi:hypothetical protein
MQKEMKTAILDGGTVGGKVVSYLELVYGWHSFGITESNHQIFRHDKTYSARGSKLVSSGRE